MAVGPCKSHGAGYVRQVRHVGAGTKGIKGESTTGTYVCFLKSRVCTLWMHKKSGGRGMGPTTRLENHICEVMCVLHYGAHKSHDKCHVRHVRAGA